MTQNDIFQRIKMNLFHGEDVVFIMSCNIIICIALYYIFRHHNTDENLYMHSTVILEE